MRYFTWKLELLSNILWVILDTASFIVYIKTDEIYKDIAEDFETRFDTSNYKLDRPLPKRRKKEVIGLMKDKLGGTIVMKLVGLRTKTYKIKKQNAQKSVS